MNNASAQTDPGRKRDSSSSALQFGSTIWRHRGLVVELVMREIKGGHAVHGLGSVWVYAQPLVVVAGYMMIFGIVIGSKIAITDTFPGNYTSYILIGVIPWLLMANALSRSTSVYISNSNIVKQVVFPIETLPVATVLATFITFLPAFAVMIAYKCFWGGGLALTATLIPLVLIMHFLIALGLTFLLSVTTPFLRDIREFVTIYLAIAMYFTPAVYLPDWVPEPLRPVLYLNPFSYIVWVYQDVLFFGEIKHGFAWVIFALMAVVAFFGGLHVFRRIRPFLGNVL
jgi:lipopolysaccharide transport system permease protein